MPKKSLKEIAEYIGGELVGDGNIEVSGIKDIEEAENGHIAFIFHSKFSSYLEKTKASCVVAPPQIVPPSAGSRRISSGETSFGKKATCAVIHSKNPAIAFIKLVELLMPGRIPRHEGIHKTVLIGKDVSLGKGLSIGAYCVIEDNAVIGEGTVIYPFCYIGHETKIGKDCIIYPNVSIRENIKIGQRVIIHPSSVIGSDGFGYDNTTGRHLKIPHIGDVIIEDDVEIGACVTVDRAKFAHTKIGRGTKIDNLVQIAHNVTIGENCIIVAQCGISGSTSLGKNVILGGQVGLVDHIKLGDNAMIGAQAGVIKSVPANSILWGTPARPLRSEKKVIALRGKLPEIYERLKRIEKALSLRAPKGRSNLKNAE